MKTYISVLQRCLAALITGGVLFFLPPSGLTQDSAGLVRPDPLVFEVGQGQVERLAIVLENAREVYGLDVRAHFDPDLIEIVDVNQEQEGVQVIPGEFPKADFVVRNQADNLMGTVMYVLTQVNPTPAANGNGVVLWIEVRGKKMGESAFVIEFVDAADREGRTLPIDKQDGVIRVVKPKPPTPTTALESTVTPSVETIEAQQPSKVKKPTKTAQITPTIQTPEVKQSRGVSTNQLLLILAGGSIVGAVVLFSYASYLSNKPKR